MFSWASLVVQWLRICLPMEGTRVRTLVREDPTCCGATKPVRHSYWACALEPASHNYWGHMPQLLKPVCLEPVLHNKRNHHNEKPTHAATRESLHAATKTQRSQNRKSSWCHLPLPRTKLEELRGLCWSGLDIYDGQFTDENTAQELSPRPGRQLDPRVCFGTCFRLHSIFWEPRGPPAWNKELSLSGRVCAAAKRSKGAFFL